MSLLTPLTASCVRLRHGHPPAVGGGLTAALVLILSTLPLAAQDGKLKLTRSALKTQLKGLLGVDEGRREKAREHLLRTRPEDFPMIMKELEKRSFEARKKPTKRRSSKRHFRIKIPVPAPVNDQVEVTIDLPGSIRSKKAQPLILRSHGAGMTGERLEELWANAGRSAGQFIAVTPDMPFPEIGGRVNIWDPKFVATYDAILRHMFDSYRIDGDRVYLSGYFMGAGFSFLMAQIWPHRFASLHASGRLYWSLAEEKLAMAAAERVPGFFIIGLTDSGDRVQGHRRVEEFYGSRPGYEGRFNFVRGKGAAQPFFDDFDAKALGFMSKKRRQRHPRVFHAAFPLLPHDPLFAFTNRSHWIRALDLARPHGCVVEVRGQNIAISSAHLRKVEVFLNDSIVNLDQEITITLDGTKRFNGRVERSLPFLLDWIEKERDPRIAYWNKVVVER